MNDVKELLRSLLRTTVHENCEDLDWTPLEPTEKRTCLSLGEFDIDFCAFSGIAEALLNDRAIASVLSAISGTFVKQPYVQRLHGYRLQKVLVICDMKPFRLALSTNEIAAESEDQLIQEENLEKGDLMDHCNYSKNVANLLANDKGRTYPFREIRTKISSLFKGFELVCFRFGQKQDIKDFLTHVQNLDFSTKVGVAIGLELSLPQFVLLVTPENISVGECFFSMFLSSQAGSVLCSSKQASKLISNSNR